MEDIRDPIIQKVVEQFISRSNVGFKKYKITPELKERISLSHGITKVKKGINPLIEKSKKEREKIKLLK